MRTDTLKAFSFEITLKRFLENVVLIVRRTPFLSLSVIAGFALSPNIARSQLISLTSGMQMTCQFVNNTNGQYSNSQIYVIAIGLNSSNQYCYLQPNGTMTPLVAGQNASSSFTPLSAMVGSGMQMPTVMTSCRMYVSFGQPLNIPINAGTPVGIAYPNIDNPSDPNINTVFDWIEFNVGNNLIFCNTTQVDMFGIPMLLQLYDNNSTGGGYSLFGTVGITEPTSQIMSEYASSVPAAFTGLAGPDRILAPIHGSFGTTGANAGYFDSYINQVWTEYTTSTLPITMNGIVYSGKVNGSGQMVFTDPGDANSYIVNKPSTNDVWGGAGNLATGNSVELALEAQICAAFHRHVIDTPANMTNPAAFYQTAPADFYSQFWHEHNVGGAAYGFCYDDVDNQSSSLVGTSPRGMILTIGGGAGGIPTPTPTPITNSTWRVVAGGPAHTDCQSNAWAADENYSGGTAATTTNTITGALPCSSDQALYQDQRYGNSFNYVFHVPAGSYQVTLKFSETYSGDFAKGDRVFNVAINGTQVLTNLDVYGTVGANTALDEIFNNIAPSSGAITIQFTGTTSTDTNADVSALQIIPQPATPTPTKTYTGTPTSTKSFTPTSTATLTFTLTDTSTPTNTFSPTMTRTMTNSPTNTYTFTSTSTSTFSLTATPTFTLTSTATKVFTATPTNTSVNTATKTPVYTNTPVNTATGTFTLTDTATPVNTATKTPVITNTPVNTATGTFTLTDTTTWTMSPTATWTYTASVTPTNIWTHSPTATSTFSSTASATNTITSTWTPSSTLTPTKTYTLTSTPSFTSTSTTAFTATFTATSLPHTATPTFTYTPVPPTSTPTVSGCAGIPAWNGNFVAYTTGQKVSYNGEIYQCIQGHTSEPNWEPPVVPALWLV